MLWQHTPGRASRSRSPQDERLGVGHLRHRRRDRGRLFRPGRHARLHVDGKHLWSRDLGRFDGPWGTAACPIIVGDLVIQNGDSDVGRLLMVALDKQTGKTVWSTPRASTIAAGARRSWSTPMGDRNSSSTAIDGVTAYDPATGKELWFCRGFNGRGEPVPAAAHGLLFVVNGLAGDIYAVRPGGQGDVTGTHRPGTRRAKRGRDLPSPIVVGNI